MNKLLQNSAVIASGAIVAAILAPLLARAVAPTPAPGFAPNDACVGNARVLINAVLVYAQDNDEILPATDTVAHFQTALTHYVPIRAIFTCPATHLAYMPNPAIGGHSLAEYHATSGTIVAFQDAQPHADHQSTVAFLDRHIERGGVEAGDPNQLCVDHVRAISLAVLQYVQDNDEHFPPLDTSSHAEAALLPYAPGARVFICPATGTPYEFNASLSYMSLASIDDPRATVVVQDSVPHDDGLRTIGYADGHVTHGFSPQPSPNQQDVANLNRIGVSIRIFGQDNNGQLPPLQNTQVLEAAVEYVWHQPSIFLNPFSGQSYTLNAAYSGVPLAQIANPAQTWLVKDRSINTDGTFNILYADGHVQTRTSFVPAHVSVGVDNATHLVWGTTDGRASISQIDASGAESSRRYLGMGLGVINRVVTAEAGSTSILFGTGDTASLLTPSFGTAHTRLVHYGPFDGWKAKGLAVGGDGLARLLWARYDKTWALWNTTAMGEYASDVRFGPYPHSDVGFGPFPEIDGAGLAAGSDNAMSIYWKRPTGETIVTRLSANAVPQTTITVPAFHGRQPVAITVAPDNTTWLLFDRTDGGATLFAFDSHLVVVDQLEFDPETGFTAKDFGVGGDGNARILWTGVHGEGRLNIVTPTGALVSSHNYLPF